MNALALYQLKSIPQSGPVVQVRPAKRAKTVELAVNANKIQYICTSCGAPTFLSSTDAVQCSSCNHRIVRKIEKKHKGSYNAV